MTIFGLILLAIGAILFFLQGGLKKKAFHLMSARPARAGDLVSMAREIAEEIGGGNWRDYVRLRGTVRAPEPLISELSQKPCVHYSMKVKREYEETLTNRSSKGSSTRTRRGSEVVADSERSIPFQLEDESGRVTVDLTDGSIETVEVLDEFKPEAVGDTIVFGGFRMNLPMQSGGRRTIGYRYTESILPVGSEVLVVGAVSDTTGELRLCQSADGEKRLVVSTKSYEALSASAQKTARWTRNVMLFFVMSGVALTLLGVFT